MLDPTAATTAIERLIDADRVGLALTGPLPNNAENLCSHPAQTDCGTLTPTVAAVIFDESRFRVELFINPLQIEARLVHLSRYLPPSSAAGLATMHLVNLAVSGGGLEAGDRINAGTTSLVARGESRLLSRYDFGDEGFSLTELSWQRDRSGWEYEAGVFRSFGRSVAFINEQDVLGVRIGRSLNTRADLDTAEGTPIFLFLNQRSRVDILRNERLLDSRFYDGGNQQLDTSRLPDGAYQIAVRIRGSDGREREENYFFVRTAQLPPRDQPLYYSEAGVVALTGDDALPDIKSDPWLRLGVAKRLRDDLGVELALLHAGKTALLEGGAFWFGPGWQLQTNLMSSTDGDLGAALIAQFHTDTLMLGLDYRRVAVGAATTAAHFDPVEESFSQGTFTVSMPVARGRLSGRVQTDSRGRERSNTGLGVSFSQPIYRRGPLTVDFEFDAASRDDDHLIRIGLQARWRRHQRYTTLRPGLQARRSATGDDNEFLLDARTTLQSTRPSLGRVTSSAFVTRETDRSLLGASVVSDSRYGRSSAELQYVSQDDSTWLTYSANSRFGIVTQDKTVAFGGRRSDLSAVIIDIAGDTDGGWFEVLIDDQSAGEARPGERTIIGLRPYATYQVRLQPRGPALVEFDDRAREVTLYPGNVQTLRFESQTVTVLVGQALWADGTPVSRARFANVDGYAATDDNGWFQVEVTHRDPLVLRNRSKGQCRLSPPDYETLQGLAVLEPLECVPIAATP